jgi:hypothetical protein
MVSSFTIPSFNTILQSHVSDYLGTTATVGYNLKLNTSSEAYIRFATCSSQLSVLYNLVNVYINSKRISTATGSDLDVVANDFGLVRRNASTSSGFVLMQGSVAQSIVQGTTLNGPNGLQYSVSTTGTYAVGSNVPVQSVNAGSQTNLGIGSIMTWSSPNSNMNATTLVSVAITGAVDQENDTTLKNRLYLTLQSPPQMGNGQQVVALSSSVDSQVQQAFVYSNFIASGTQLIALTGYQTTSYIGRDIPKVQSDGYVKPYGITQLQPGLIAQPGGYGAYNAYSSYLVNPGQNLQTDTSLIYNQLPGTVANPYATIITTVNNTPADLAAVLTLPYPQGAGQNGFGSGWTDFNPWPSPDGYYIENACTVNVVLGPIANGYGIVINAPSSGIYNTSNPNVPAQVYSNNTPTAGQTHIQWVNRSDSQETGWSVVNATILQAIDNGNNTWTLILDTPLVFPTGELDFYGNETVAVGDYIFPASQNASNYLSIIMSQFAILGPGEVTLAQGLQTLGAARYPSESAQFPNVIGSQLEQALVQNNSEVYAATVRPPTAYNTAFSPPSANCPPNIYIPRNIGIYPIEKYNFGLI